MGGVFYDAALRTAFFLLIFSLLLQRYVLPAGVVFPSGGRKIKNPTRVGFYHAIKVFIGI